MDTAKDLTNVTLDGRYRLTRLLGEGGMGQVYEGIHELLDRKVAVKVLLPRYAYEVKFRERFLREAKAASKVRHPNIVQILDFGDTPQGSVYFAMEFLEGVDMQGLLRGAGGRLSWSRTRHLLLQITSAIGAAHERGIIHRDIKPANFFIINARGHQEFIKVLDFGIAKIAVEAGDDSEGGNSLTNTGEVFGTAKYMAPEQAFGASDDPRVDVYSLGIVAYQMLTGQVPFQGSSAFEILTRHVNDQPRSPCELNPEVPPAAEALIVRALAKQPDDRFASMDEMGVALAAIPANAPGRGIARGRGVAPPSLRPAPVSALAAPVLAAPPGLTQSVAVENSMQMTARAPARPRVTLRAPMSVPAGVQESGAQEISEAPVPAVSPGSGTSIMPTQLRTPSSVALGEFGRGPPSETGIAGSPNESGELGVVGSTSQMIGIGVADGGATAPVTTGMMSSLALETDSHAVLGASAPGSSSKGLIIGVLAALVVGGVVVIMSIGQSSDEAESPTPQVASKVIEPRTPVVTQESASAGATLDAEVVVDPVEEPIPSAVVAPEPEPEPEPEPTPVTTSPAAPAPKRNSGATQPPTDKRVRSRLARKLEKKCKSVGNSGSVTVELLIGTSGSVVGKKFPGASSTLTSCLIEGVSGAKFPEGSLRKMSFKVGF